MRHTLPVVMLTSAILLSGCSAKSKRERMAAKLGEQLSGCVGSAGTNIDRDTLDFICEKLEDRASFMTHVEARCRQLADAGFTKATVMGDSAWHEAKIDPGGGCKFVKLK